MKITNVAAGLLACALAAGCETPKVSQEEMQAVNFGPAPVHWKQEIESYLKLRLRDPVNAVVDFRTEPKKMFQKQVGLDAQHHGWAVCLVVRDRTSGGQWREPYPMTVFIRNEKIVHVNNGPDDIGPIGPAYARRQCKELGAKDLP